MKFNYDIVVFDLEATVDQDENGLQKNNSIIELGAVFLDRNTLEIKSEFSTLIKPKDLNISNRTTEITKIAKDQLKDAPNFVDAIKSFECWCGEHSNGNLKNIRLCAWGSYFDGPLLRRECNNHKLSFRFSGTILCAKSMVTPWLAMSGHRTDKSSVSRVAQLLNISPDGQYHRALTDARVTAKILQKAIGYMAGGVYIQNKPSTPPIYVKIEKE